MKLKIRTLNNDECEVEVDESDSVTVLKTKVQEKFPSMESSKQKLIHTGKILQNELKISDYPAIKENDRVVVMVTKAAPPKSSTDLSSSSSSSSTASASTTPSSASSPSSSSTSSTPAPTPPVASEATSTSSVSSDTSPAADVATAVPAAASGATAATDSTTAPPRESGSVTATGGGYDSAASALVTGSQLEETVNFIVSMGFSVEAVQTAMHAAYNNPDRAVEYLMNGLPEHARRSQHSTAAPAAAQAPATPADAPAPAPAVAVGQDQTAAAPPAASGNPLEALRRHPQFSQIRQLVQTNPAALSGVLENIRQSNPALLEMINQHPQAFMDLLQEPGQSGGGAPPAVVTIPMTQAEMEAMQRLEGLGFPRRAVQEAFLACDRNEEMAANYLFENADDLMGADEGGEVDAEGADEGGNI
eukprot:GHVQ01033522.1.p1 GENE.GHVQ01033522.1~~GHVQ01033522.1.p1  ORF type:complete len:419 (+),score=98.30 GHVQ01033522.1:228-1484(+)